MGTHSQGCDMHVNACFGVGTHIVDFNDFALFRITQYGRIAFLNTSHLFWNVFTSFAFPLIQIHPWLHTNTK